MALYKYASDIRQTNAPAFDAIWPPDTTAHWPGIYQCNFCGHEIATERHQLLPALNHHQHQADAPIEWKLVVSTREGSA